LINSLALAPNGSGDMVLTWSPTTNDQTYVIESKDNLTNDWISVSVPGVDGSMSTTSTVGTAEFFRVGTE
jgi:hypothetical protein